MTLLEMAVALDGMDRDVSSWEADFLESVLLRLNDGRPISPKQEAKLRELHERYLAGDGDGDDDGRDPGREREGEGDFNPDSF